MSLFDVAIERKNSGYAQHAEPRYEYLNRSARLSAGRMRAVIEEWFSEYPVEDKGELKRRFRSKKPWAYESAFFELALHAMLRRLGCEMEVHPDIPGKPTHPEFLVKPNGGGKFFLEAVLCSGQTEEEIAAEKLRATILDALNQRVRSYGFLINLHFFGTPKKQPSGKRIAKFVQAKLASLDPDKIAADYPRVGQNGVPRWPYRIDDDCRLEFEPIARKREVRGTPAKRALGMISQDGRFVDDITPIREAVLRKADHYGDVPHPFVIAINLMSVSVEDDDIIAALIGSDGIWNRQRAKRVSAILVARWLMASSVPRTQVQLFHNPLADRPYDSVLTVLPQVFTRETGIVHTDGRTLADIFGLAPDWPKSVSDPKDE